MDELIKCFEQFNTCMAMDIVAYTIGLLIFSSRTSAFLLPRDAENHLTICNNYTNDAS